MCKDIKKGGRAYDREVRSQREDGPDLEQFCSDCRNSWLLFLYLPGEVWLGAVGSSGPCITKSNWDPDRFPLINCSILTKLIRSSGAGAVALEFCSILARMASCLIMISLVMYASRRILSRRSDDMSGMAHRTRSITIATIFWNGIQSVRNLGQKGDRREGISRITRVSNTSKMTTNASLAARMYQ